MLFKKHFTTISLILCLLGSVTAYAQPSLTKVFVPNTIGPGSHTTATFTLNNGSASPVTALSFNDTLPAGVTVSDPAVVFTDCDLSQGSIVAPDGGASITLIDAQLGAFGSCSITVATTSSTLGTHTNPAVTLSSSAGSSMSLPVDLIVESDRPGFSKSFTPSSVPFGSRTTLTFTIDNTLNAAAITNINFTDNLPTGLEIADPANLNSDCTDAVFTATPGSSSITMSGASNNVPAASVCTVSLDVSASAVGMMINQSNGLTATDGGFTQLPSGYAIAALDVESFPVHITKSFTNDPVAPGSTVGLTFTVNNFNRDFALSNLSFSDDLNGLSPSISGLVFDSLVANTCGGNIVGIGTEIISLSNGNIAAQSSCQVEVELLIPAATAAGAYLNTSGIVSGIVDGSSVTGNQASDVLFVDFAPVFTKEFIDDPAAAGGTTTLRFTITNTDPNSDLTAIEFTDDIGGTVDPRVGTIPFMTANSLIAAGGLSPEPMLDVCGIGSVLTIPDPNDTLPSPPFPDLPPDPTLLVFTGGNLTAAGTPGDSCFFDVVLEVPTETASGTYTNTTTNLVTASGTYLSAEDNLVVIGAPVLTKAFIDDPVAPGDAVTLEFTLSNSENSPEATNISFTDDLNAVLAGLVINLPPTPDPPCGVGSSLTAPGNVLTFTGGQLLPAQGCTFSVTLDIPVAAQAGIYPNTTSEVTALASGLPTNSPPASDNLQISGLLFSKSFVDDPVIAGEIVRLSYTIENTHPTEDATAITFADTLSAVLPGTPDLVATLPPASDNCGGIMSGPTNLSYTGGTVSSGSSCIIELDVLVPAGTADGSYNSISSSLTATQGTPITVSPAVDVLEVNSNIMTLSKQFVDDPVAPGANVTLEFTVNNTDLSNDINNISFTDDLSATLSGLVATGLPINDVCGTGSQLSGTSLLTLTGGNLTAASNCTFSVTLTVPAGATPGTYPNTTSAVTGTSNGLPVTGTPATDSLDIINALSFSMAFDGPTTPSNTAVLTFIIDNISVADASNLAFSDDLDAVIPGLIATGLPVNNSCGTGSQVTGSSLINLTGGNLLAGSSCSFNITVLVPAGVTPGTYNNITSDLTDNGLLVAQAATADLVIEPAPLFSKQFAPSAIGTNQTASLSFVVDNTASALAVNNLDFTDNLPAGMIVASPANASTTCTGGVITAVDGSGVVSYTGGSVAANSLCTLQVDIIAISPGVLINVSGDLTSSSGNSGPANASLTVNSPPTFNKVFAPNPTVINGVVTLTFTIDNTTSSAAAGALDFTDNMPAGLVVANTPNISTTCVGGTLVGVAGTSTVSYTGGTVPAMTACTIAVDVTAANSGTYNNLSGILTSSLGNSGPAADTLIVSDAMLFTKSFTPDLIASGATSTLVFTLDNTFNNQSATGVDFVDNMPIEMVVGNPANLITDCTGGTLTAVSGSSSVSYTGGTVPANSSCNISVDVTSSTPGTYDNITSDLTSSLGNSGTAADTLTVSDALLFSKSFTPDVIFSGGTSTLTFTLDNITNNQAATGVEFTDNMPAAIVIANPANSLSTCTGGTLTATSGTSSISYQSGTVAANASCTISIDVTSSTTGIHNNITSDLISSAGNSGTANATLQVEQGLTMSKTFNTAGSVNPGDAVEMLLTITNNASIAATQITFVDDLSAFIAGSTAQNLPQNDVCGPGSVVSGTSIINLSNGNLTAGSSCQISIQVSIPANTSNGTYTNTTGPISANINGNTIDGGPASTGSAILGIIGGSVTAVPAVNLGWLMILLLATLISTHCWLTNRK